MQKFSDQELVAQYIDTKDHQYLTELFMRHSDIVYRTALRTMKNTSDAEDIMQIAYIKMISNLHLYSGKGSVLGWMLQMVVYCCYDRLRSEKSRLNRERKIMSERVQKSNHQNEELKEIIDNHLNKLPEIYRAPITLQILEGLTIKEVSEVLQIPEKTIRSQITRGLEKLKASLQNVGVTASIVSLGELLKEVPQPIAPEVYKTNQYFNSIFQNKTSVSAKVAVATSAKKMAIMKALGFTILSIATIAAGLFLINSQKIATPSTSSAFLSQKWDFENIFDLPSYQNMALKNGAISFAPNMGIDHSNALLVSSESLIELDISKYKLPIKISYSSDYFVTKNLLIESLQLIIKDNYVEGKNITLVSGIREHLRLPPFTNKSEGEFRNNWLSNVAYVDDSGVDLWMEGFRHHFLSGTSKDNKKVYLYIKGKSLIDNLVIESIEHSKLPDKKECLNVLASTEYKGGSNKISIDKEKFGINKKRNVNPYMIISNTKSFINSFKLNNEPVMPRLNETKTVEWSVVRQKISKKWTFDDSSDLEDFKLIRGKIEVLTSRGENKTNCLLIEPDTMIEIDISKFKLPVKISHSFDCIVPPPGKTSGGVIFSKSNFVKNKNIFHFFRILGGHSILPIDKKLLNENSMAGYFGVWSVRTMHITEDFTDSWFFGKRRSLIYGSSEDNKKVYFINLEKSLIDNFIIESVEPEAIPDATPFISYVANIPFGKTRHHSLEKDKALLKLEKESQAELTIFEISDYENAIGFDKLKIEGLGQ